MANCSLFRAWRHVHTLYSSRKKFACIRRPWFGDFKLLFCRTATKYTNICKTHKLSLYCSLNLLFLCVHNSVAVVGCLGSHILPGEIRVIGVMALGLFERMSTYETGTEEAVFPEINYTKTNTEQLLTVIIIIRNSAFSL